MSKRLIPAQRRVRIRELLEANRIVSGSELSESLGVSEATIRRDLECMEADGILERTHGGAILSRRMKLEPEYAVKVLAHPEEKSSIGALAASLIEEGDIVFTNSGTTCAQVIRHIPSGWNVTVITSNLGAALEVRDGSVELILLGGTVYPRSNSVGGRFASETLRQVYANKTFVGVDGMSPKHGFTVPSGPEAEIIRMMIERTRGPVIVVADHSKWGVVSDFEVARLDQIHTLVTDEGFDARASAELATRNVRVLVAGADSSTSSNAM